MKKNLSVVLLYSTFLLLLPITAFAAFDLSSVLGTLNNTLFGIAISFSVIMFIWAGFLFATSKVDEGKKVVIWAIVGIIVCVLSFSIYGLLQNFLGGIGGSSSGGSNNSGGGSSQICPDGSTAPAGFPCG